MAQVKGANEAFCRFSDHQVCHGARMDCRRSVVLVLGEVAAGLGRPRYLGQFLVQTVDEELGFTKRLQVLAFGVDGHTSILSAGC
ncbi:hypothetical protein B0G38_002551 [Arthrobacter sp. VKM Ac-2550]|nr:hypothetical protein [Arthrobacter sp. VKM Ac-2550]